jgi:uncharacterized membrane protein YkvA (DUF1232 family)
MSFIEKWKNAAKRMKIELHAVLLACGNPKTPWYAKLFAGAVLAYAASPIDLIPDFIPVVGYLDDLIIVPLGLWLALKMIPPDVMKECRAKAAEAAERPGGIGRWIFAALIILFWLALLAALAYFIFIA